MTAAIEFDEECGACGATVVVVTSSDHAQLVARSAR